MGLVPSRFIKSDSPDLKITLLGQEYQYPIAIAPVGVQRIFHRDGEIATATAALHTNVPYIMSSAASTSLEDVAFANGEGLRWYQLYWPSNENNEITASLLKRAHQAKYSVLIVTVDTFALGWRPSDLENGYNPFPECDRNGIEIGLSDPVFRRLFVERHNKEVEEDLGTAAVEWTRTIVPGQSHSWDDLEFLRQHWSGPIVIKGIQIVEDAKRAVDYGIEGIVVSNHGGRQQDAGIGSFDVLPEIVSAVGHLTEVIFDSGIRSGADVAKALAMGARMVLVGRPYVYGLAIGGELSVSHVLRTILSDLNLTLHLAGIPSVSRKYLNSKLLRRVN